MLPTCNDNSEIFDTPKAKLLRRVKSCDIYRFGQIGELESTKCSRQPDGSYCTNPRHNLKRSNANSPPSYGRHNLPSFGSKTPQDYHWRPRRCLREALRPHRRFRPLGWGRIFRWAAVPLAWGWARPTPKSIIIYQLFWIILFYSHYRVMWHF